MSKLVKTARIAIVATFLLVVMATTSVVRGQSFYYNTVWSPTHLNVGWFSSWHHYATSNGAFRDGSNWNPDGAYHEYYDWATPLFSGSGGTDSHWNVYLGATRNHLVLPSGDSLQWNPNILPGTYVAYVSDIYFTGGNYNFYGLAPTNTISDAPQLVGEAGHGGSGKLFMRMSDSGYLRLSVATQFKGGIELDSGRFDIVHDGALGVYRAGEYAPDGTTKLDYSGVINVRGNSGTSPVLRVSLDMDPQRSQTIQNRFEVTQGKTLSFGSPYHPDSNPVLAIANVDTSGYTYPSGTANADVPGGAIYLATGADLSRWKAGTQNQGAVAFLSNKAKRGGAIYATNNLTLEGNLRFENNSATERGGAIYMLGLNETNTLTLNASSDSGDLLFRGNTANGISQSIYLENNTTVNITGSRYIYFEDAIQTGVSSANNSLTVNITPSLGITNGFVQFAPDASLATNSIISVAGKDGGRATVQAGEFRIINGATFSTLGNDSYFIVDKNTDTEARLAGNGTIEAGRGFVIQGTLAPDNHRYAVPDQLNVAQSQGKMPEVDYIGTLNLRGDVTLSGATYNVDNDITGSGPVPPIAGYASDRIVVKANSQNTATGKIAFGLGQGSLDAERNTVIVSTWDPANPGKYIIATSDKGFFNAQGDVVTNDTMMQYFHQVTTKDGNLTGRQGASIFIEQNLLGDGEHDLVLNTSNNANLYLVWDSTGNRQWVNSDTLLNWRSTRSNNPSDFDTPAKVAGMERMGFRDGDYLYFNANVAEENQAVDLQGGSRIVSGMEILNGNYTFYNGTKITGTSDNTIGVVASGKLRVDGSDTTVKLDVETEFDRGAELSGGATVILGTDTSLGEYAGTATGQAGVVTLTPYVDNDGVVGSNGNATIIAGYEGVVNTVSNHFEILNGSELTLDIQEGTTYTIQNVHTEANTIGYKGGVFNIENNAKILRQGDGLLHLNNNSAIDGGALYVSSTSFTLYGNTLITNNRATTGKGGAIYMADRGTNSNLILDTDNGDIAFSGNTAGGVGNSVHLERNIHLTVQGSGNVFFDDAISTGTQGGNKISVNLDKDKFVQFKGDNVLNPASQTGGLIEVNSGIFRVVSGAMLSTDGNPTTPGFNVIGRDGTLAGGGTITVGGNRGFNINGTISADNDTLTHGLGGATGKFVVGSSDAERIGTLRLIGKTTFDGAIIRTDVGANQQADLIDITGSVTFNTTNGRNIINIIPGATTQGPYTILQSDISLDGIVDEASKELALTKFQLQVNGVDYVASVRQTARLDIVNGSANYSKLILDFTYKNLDIRWTGAVDNQWDMTTANWASSDSTPLTFGKYDYVVFDQNGQNTMIEVTDNWDVSGMRVEGGDYGFFPSDTSHGKIVGRIQATGTGQTNDGKLTVSGGSVILALKTDFEKGTELRGGGRIFIADNDALGVYNAALAADGQGYVNVTGNGTIALHIDDPTLAYTVKNRINIDPAASSVLEFDIAEGRKLTYDSVTAPAGASNGGVLFVGEYGDIRQTNTGALVFNANRADKGGAIYAESNLTIGGNTLFSNNQGATGGAIYMEGKGLSNTLTLDATNGSIGFSGNGNPAGSDAIHLEKNTTLAASGTGNVYMNDAVTSGTAGGNALQVAMGSDSAFLQLNADSTINATGREATAVTVSGGALRINDGKTLNVLGSGATVTVNGNGTALGSGILAGGGTINASSFVFNGGMISPDKYLYGMPLDLSVNGPAPSTPTNPIGTLTLAGNAVFNAATFAVDLPDSGTTADLVNVTGSATFTGGKSTVYVTSLNPFANESTYDILDAGSSLVLMGGGIGDTFNSILFADGGSSGGGRSTATLKLKDGDDSVLQLVIQKDGALQVIWTGNVDSIWYSSGSTLNWKRDDAAETPVVFNNGDYAVFNGSDTHPQVKVANGGVIVSGMEITAGSYVFGPNNGNTPVISGVKNSALPFSTGRLDILGGQATFNLATNFEYGTLLSGGAQVIYGHDQALGTYTGMDSRGVVSVDGTGGTIASSVDRTIQNKFEIQNGATLTLLADTGALTLNGPNPVHFAQNATLVVDGPKDVTFASPITADTAGGNMFVKNGDGTVSFNGANVLNGSVMLNKGRMNLAANGSFRSSVAGSQFTQHAGTTLQVGNGGTIEAAGGFDLAGNLLVGEANSYDAIDLIGNVRFNGANYHLDISSDGVSSDVVNIDGRLSFGGTENKNTITLNGWGLGTYDIVETTGGIDLAGNDISDYFNPLTTGGRTSASLQVNGNTLQLITVGSRSSYVTWTGKNGNKWNFDTTSNWQNNATLDDTTFVDGDFVLFDENGMNTRIQIEGDRTVSGMIVSGGTYDFSGGKITGDEASAQGSDVTGSGKLQLYGGTTTINNETSFRHGTEMAGGAKVVVENEKSLGVYTNASPEGPGYVKIIENETATVATTTTLGVTNRFDVGQGATLNMDIGSGKFTIQNVDASGANPRNGGAINIAAGATFTKLGSGELVLSGNKAVNGGGIATLSDLVLSGEFLGNEASQNGGAIHADANLTILGQSTFTGNTATLGQGGAIYMAGSQASVLTLDSSAGDIAFSGNTGNGSLNSVFLNQNTALVVQGDANSVLFGDPIDSGSNGGNSFQKLGAGTVVFSGNNYINRNGAGGAASVLGGTMRLDNGASFTTLGSDSTFILSGATLSGSGTITAGNGFVLSGTIDADSKDLAGNGSDIGEIRFVGNTLFDGANLLVDLPLVGSGSDLIDISGTASFGDTLNTVTLKNWVNGSYTLVATNGGIDDPNGKWNIVFPSGAIASDRQKAALSKVGNDMVLNLSSTNDKLTWSGEAGMEWNSIDKSWRNGNNNPDQFVGGDTVIFAGYGEGTITVAQPGMLVSGMTVSSGTYTFIGEKITGRTEGTSLSQPTGKLTATGGNVTFANAVEMEKGFDFYGNAKVTLTETGSMTTGEEFRLDKNATLTVTPHTGMIKAGTITLDGKVNVLRPEGVKDGDTILAVLEATSTALEQDPLRKLFDRSYALHGQYASFSPNGMVMDLTYNQISLNQFAEMNDLHWNEREVANTLTDLFNKGQLKPLWDGLLELTTNAEVEFFLDDMRGAEMAADVMQAALWSPWRPVYNHLNQDQREVPATAFRYERVYRGQAGAQPTTRDVWVEGFHRTIEASTDKNAHSYILDRTGTVIGIDKRINVMTTLGAVFNYSTPQLTSRKFGKVETNDWGMAVYAKRYITDDLYINNYLGFGHQEYRYTRHSLLFGTNKARYDGNSLYMSSEIVRPLVWNYGLTLMPLIALDFQKTWVGDFEEQGGVLPMKIRDGEMGTLTGRIGLNSRWRVVEDFSVDTRFQYIRMLDGNTYGSVNGTIAGLPVPSDPMSLRGIDLGRDTLQIGIGCQATVTKKRNLFVFFDYDYEVGNKATAHTGQIGFVNTW